MKCKTLWPILTAVVTLIGCGGVKSTNLTPSSSDKAVETIPDWMDNPPHDSNYLFAATTATSRDLQMASNKAKTAARVELAKQLETRMDVLTKNFQEEIGEGNDSEFLQQFTLATKDITSQTLNGSRIDKQKVISESGIFRAYVLMSLPIGDENRKLMETLRENKNLYTRFKSTEAFEELNKELEALKDK